MSHVTSQDGTHIAYERTGTGPAVILVGGGLDDGSENAPMLAVLGEHFTVYNYARRGRAGSGDTQPYALRREIEDLEALITEAGGQAHLYGVSSGGGLALEAAAAGLAVGRLAVYEVPYNLADDAPEKLGEYVTGLKTAIANDRPGDAVELFMRLAGSSEEDIAGARESQWWPGLEVLAHTLVYDAACFADPSAARLATVTQPTLVLTGDTSPKDAHMGGLPDDFFGRAADWIAATVPSARRESLKGQGHVADPNAVAAVLEPFFRA